MSDDDEYEVPLQDQRVFGAGIKRKRVKFVPSTATTASATTSSSKSSASDIASRYLSLVLPSSIANSQKSTAASSDISTEDVSTTCEVCKLPLLANEESGATSHSTTLAHQVCLPHSHPPSHLDRSRKGLSILSSYGWDPDSRLGLGASGQGISFPIKVKEKSDKLGVGVVVPSNAEMKKKVEEKAKEREERRKLDAGRLRIKAAEERKQGEALQRQFYSSDDVDRYLKAGDEWE